MKRLFLAATALALTSCGGRPTVPPPATTPAPPVDPLLYAERRLAAAEIAYAAAASGVEKLVDQGLITGTTATQVRAWNGKARALLVRGKDAVDAAEKLRAASEVLGFAGKLNSLLGVR